jgi:hypothetical protein
MENTSEVRKVSFVVNFVLAVRGRVWHFGERCGTLFGLDRLKFVQGMHGMRDVRKHYNKCVPMCERSSVLCRKQMSCACCDACAKVAGKPTVKSISHCSIMVDLVDHP